MTHPPSRALVVGADGLVGASLAALLRQTGARVTETTRRAAREGALVERIDLDLASEDATMIPVAGFSVAYLCAAITSIADCERDPARSQSVNVHNTVILAQRLIAAGTRIVFLSSNMVFDGTHAWPPEDAALSPVNEYGRQKAAAERALLALSTATAPVAVVRLSKVMTSSSGIAAEFLGRLAAGMPCPAFDDLRMSPISLTYATRGLLAAADSMADGIFHLSSAQEMSYAELACQLATCIGADPALVRPQSSAASGAQVLFRPAHPGLGMPRTRGRLGIAPEPVANVMAALAQRTMK